MDTERDQKYLNNIQKKKTILHNMTERLPDVNFWKNKSFITGHTSFKGTWLKICLKV